MVRCQLGFGAPIPGPHSGGVPIVWQPFADPQPAFFGGPFGGFPLQRNFQPQREMRHSGAQYLVAPQQSQRHFLSPMSNNPQSSCGSNVPDPLDANEITNIVQRRKLYSISYLPSSNPLVQNAPHAKSRESLGTSGIFYEYRSASEHGVLPADFLNNYYGNVDSNRGGSPLAKICKMELTTPITIGSCVIDGERNYIDINEGGNKTRIHIDNEGARDLEKYRILVREELQNFRNNFDFNSLDQNKFKELKSVTEFINFFQNHPPISQGGQSTNDDKILDAFADTFISNNLKAGRFYTETRNSGVNYENKDFAYVKIERPINDEKKINVTVSDKYSAQLNSININAGKNSKDEEVFFQLSLEEKDDKQVIAKDSLKFFTKNKDGTFKEEKMEKGVFWGFKNIHELGDAKDKIINIFTHEVKKDEAEKNELKYKIKKGAIHPQFQSFSPKKKCGELNDFTDHEFVNAQSRSASPQAGAREGLQSPGQVPGGGGGAQKSLPQAQSNIVRQQPPAPILMTGGGAPAQMQGQQVHLMLAPGMEVVSPKNLRSPTKSEIAGGADPTLQILMRPGGGGVTQGPVYMGGVPPMMQVPQTNCQPFGGGQPMQPMQGGHRD